MIEFPAMLPWDEMTAMVKRHEEYITAFEKDLCDAREYIAGLETALITRNKGIVIQNEKFQEQITTLQREQAETQELVYCLEKQLDALEKVGADLTEASPLPEKAIQPVLDERFVRAFKQLTLEQRKMLSEPQEDDCIF